MSEFKLVASNQKYVGKWQIGGAYGLGISQHKKPRWITRYLCKLLLEWEWIDN